GGETWLGLYCSWDTINILRTRIHGREQLRPLESSEGGLRNLQHLPDQRRGVLDFLEAFGRCRTQLHGGKRRLDHVSRTKMWPVLTGELIKCHESFPIIGQPLNSFRCQLPIASGELCPERLTGCPCLSIGHRTQQRTGLGVSL